MFEKIVYSHYNLKSNLNTELNVKPYLGVKAKLSQSWINYLIFYLLILFIRQLYIGSTISLVFTNLKDKFSDLCLIDSNAKNAISNSKYYTVQASNELITYTINHSIQEFRKGIITTINGIAILLYYYIDFLFGTYICLFTTLVEEISYFALNSIEDIITFINSSLATTVSLIDNEISNFNNLLNRSRSSIATIPSFLSGEGITIPTINIPQISNLTDIITIPSSVTDEINAVKDKIPSFSDVQDNMKSAIKLPFNSIAQNINNTLQNYTFQMPQDSLQKYNINDINQITDCSLDLFTTKIDSLLKDINKYLTIIGIILICLFLLSVIIFFFWEFYKCSLIQGYYNDTQFQNNNMSIQEISCLINNPIIGNFGLFLAKFFHTQKSKSLTRWLIYYLFNDKIIFLLGVSLFTFLSFILTLIFNNFLINKANNILDNFTTVNSAFYNQTDLMSLWINDTNSFMIQSENQINQNLTKDLQTNLEGFNDTLTLFQTGVTTAINETFGSGPLYKPVLGIMECIVLDKVKSLQEVLTWTEDIMHITFPSIPNDIAEKLSAEYYVNDITSSFSNKISDKMLSELNNQTITSSKLDLYIFVFSLCLWLLFAFLGVSYVIYKACSPYKLSVHK